jgi:hypothetical protein
MIYLNVSLCEDAAFLCIQRGIRCFPRAHDSCTPTNAPRKFTQFFHFFNRRRRLFLFLQDGFVDKVVIDGAVSETLHD